MDIDKAAALEVEVFGLAGAALEADAAGKHSAALLLDADPADQRVVPQQKLPPAREVKDKRSAKATNAEGATEECAAMEVNGRGDDVPDPQVLQLLCVAAWRLATPLSPQSMCCVTLFISCY